jgi:hypothetical protein
VDPAGLWLAVVASGAYHGLNPAMGWPLAVSAALMGRGRRDLVAALGSLALGHFLAMAAILLPFAMLSALLAWQRQIRLGAAAMVGSYGLFLLVRRRHARFVTRIPPSQLGLWSFAVAIAHGAGLMLVPIYLGLCAVRPPERMHMAAAALVRGDLGAAVAVSLVHTATVIAAAGLMAYAVYAWLGLRVLRRIWFNLDLLWAGSLVAVGGVSFGLAWAAA